MRVIDASVMLGALTEIGPAGEPAREAIEEAGTIHVPAIFAAEVASGLRRLVANRKIDERVARVALGRLTSIDVIEHAFGPFASRVWTLRDNVSIYDAWYVALAESLDAALWTVDRRVASAPGPRCTITLVG